MLIVLKKMETRHREYQELKNALVDLNCFEDGMELEDMRNLLLDLHLEDIDGETNYLELNVQEANKGKSDKALAKHKQSPLWSRDETHRLTRKNKSKPKNIAAVNSTSKSPSWQRVDYGCVQRHYNGNAFQNGRILNSTMKKGLAEQKQADVLNTAFDNSVQLVPVNCSPQSQTDMLSKNRQISNSSMMKSSHQAGDGWQRVDYGCVQKRFNVNAPQNGRILNSTMKKVPPEKIHNVDVLNTAFENSQELAPINCNPPSPSGMISKNRRILNSTLQKSSYQDDAGLQESLPNSTTSYRTFWSPLWRRTDNSRLERKHYITDFDVNSFYQTRKLKTLRIGNSGVSRANGHEPEKKISSDDNTNVNNENVTSNWSLNGTNDIDEIIDQHSQSSNSSSADLNEDQPNSVNSLSKAYEIEQSYGMLNFNLALNNNNDINENVDHSQSSNSNVDSPNNVIILNESEQSCDTISEYSNDTSRSDISDVDRSETISDTNTGFDSSISFDIDNDVYRVHSNFETVGANSNNAYDENFDTYLSTLYEEDDESMDDIKWDISYVEIPTSQHY